jgi:hypothetical protein
MRVNAKWADVEGVEGAFAKRVQQTTVGELSLTKR